MEVRSSWKNVFCLKKKKKDMACCVFESNSETTINFQSCYGLLLQKGRCIWYVWSTLRDKQNNLEQLKLTTLAQHMALFSLGWNAGGMQITPLIGCLSQFHLFCFSVLWGQNFHLSLQLHPACFLFGFPSHLALLLVFLTHYQKLGASLVTQWQRIYLPIQEMHVPFSGWENPLEKEMAIHSSILAWEIPWTEEPGRRQSSGSQK